MKNMLDKSILLVLGKERFLKDRLVADAEQKTVSGPFGKDFNFSVFRGTDAKLADILDTANTLPVMAERRLVVVRDFDLLKDCKKILDLYHEPSDTTLLILCSSDEDWFFTLDKAFQKKFESLYGDEGAVKNFYDMTRDDIREWLREAFAREGKKAGDDVIAYIMDICGEKLLDLQNEVVKICWFHKDKKDITLEEARKLLSRNTDASIEKIRKAVLKREISSVLRLYALYEARYGGKSDLILLLSDLARYFRNLMKAWDLKIREGYSRNQIENTTEFKLRYFEAKNMFFAAMDNFQPYELQRILSMFHPMDKILKSSSDDVSRIYFERFLMALCRRR